MSRAKINRKSQAKESDSDEWDFKIEEPEEHKEKKRSSLTLEPEKKKLKPTRLKLEDQSNFVRKSRTALAREEGATKKKAPTQKVPANLLKRGFAFLFDLALFAAGGTGAIFLGAPLTDLSTSIFQTLGLEVPLDIDTYTIVASALFVYFVVNVATVVIFRATIGKALMGLRVRGYHYVDLNFKSAIAREFLFKPFSMLLLIDFVMPLFNKDRRALHDFLSSSMVVKKGRRFR